MVREYPRQTHDIGNGPAKGFKGGLSSQIIAAVFDDILTIRPSNQNDERILTSSDFQHKALAVIDRAVKRCQGLTCSPVAEVTSDMSGVLSKVVICRQARDQASRGASVELDVYHNRVQVIFLGDGKSSMIASLPVNDSLEERILEILTNHFDNC